VEAECGVIAAVVLAFLKKHKTVYHDELLTAV
jgi:hypothetical protein